MAGPIDILISKAVLWCAAVVLLASMVVSGLAFMHGSLELFPTEEQVAKARLVYGSVFVASALLELAVVNRLRVSSR